jgi:carboxymethylenebutenolidase
VTSLQQYIAEEIATDHADGLLSRREALRRLALLGLGGGAAAALIAACGGGKAQRPSESSGTTGTQPPGMDRVLPTEPMTWSGPRGQLQGAWSQAHNARRGVLVIPRTRA